MSKKVTYKEPTSYFTPEMLKVAKEWDKAHPKKTETKPAPAKKGKK